MVNTLGIRFTPEEREEKRAEAANLYTAGHAIKDIAEVLGCAYATVSVLLKESGVERRAPQAAALPEGMITATEAAELAGMSRAAFTTLRHRDEGPPLADRPAGAHGYYTYYWRKDVEDWLGRREQRRQEILLRQTRRAEARRRALENRNRDHYVPDWAGLMEAVDCKRVGDGLSWEEVAMTVCVDPGQMSRLKNGAVPPQGWNLYFRLCAWVQDGLPPELEGYVIKLA